MGSVVPCSDPNLDRTVAVKFLQPGCDTRRIFDEVRALQRISSKHVVQVFDVVVVPPANSVGIVQEYLPRADLTRFHEQNADTGEYLRALYQLARGLEDIHRHGLIHRDMKPSNAKRDQEGIIKIFDFGLSRAPSDAQTAGFVGTRGFAAPELYASGIVHFTPAVDTYALAVTALWLSRGTLPPEFMTSPPQAHAWVSKAGFAAVAPALPAPVARLLNQALANSPAARPEMETIRLAIERHLVEGQHRALLVHNGNTHTLHSTQRSVTLAKSAMGSISIGYNGLTFSVSSASGDVYINNVPVQVGHEIPACCVITIGGPEMKSRRAFITMDVSHPEVVL
jgi:eukaryotic-like serine/threonine-protein kinase